MNDRTIEENRYFQAFEVSGIGMTITDLKGRFLEVNPAFCQLLGYRREELLDMTVHDITHPEDQGEIQTNRSKLANANTTVQTVEKRYVTKSGEIMWGGLIRSAIRDEDGRPLYVIGQLRDITKRKQLDALKDEFISMVSHELRTPLTSIHGALSLVKDDQVLADPDRLGNLLEIAKRNSDRLLDLVNDILDFERLEAGRMAFTFTNLDLNSLAEKCIQENAPYAEELNVSFEFKPSDGQAIVQADDARLSQVITNLLSNAAKFSPKECAIQVEISGHEDIFRLSVSDGGPGIDPRDREKVFEPFSQLDGADDKQVNGTGLGLSICKRIMEAHGGVIDFEPRADAGVTFFIELEHSPKG